MVILPLIVNW